jgi:hypothetical protein
MAARSFRPRRRPQAGAPAGRPSLEELVREAKTARSLALHGWICARCAREFEAADLHLLTVHHKDGNHDHNPPDGSNWENLCVYCHEDEHTRGILGDYLTGRDVKDK